MPIKWTEKRSTPLTALAVASNLPPMETTAASIAAMNAILTHGLGESVTAMDRGCYERLEGYFSAMVQAKQMLSKGLISADEYNIIDTIMAEKYGIPSCSLFRDNDLLCKETDGNMSHNEEVTKCQEQ